MNCWNRLNNSKKKLKQQLKFESEGTEINKHKVFLLMGESGSGKTALSKMLENRGYSVLQSYTTRLPREKDEWGHKFCTFDEYNDFKSSEQIVAYTYFNDHHYFCTKQQLLESDIYVIDPDGIKYLKEHVSDIDFVTVHVKVDKKTRIDRMYERGDDIDAVLKRITNDGIKFCDKKFEYAVSNVDLNKATKIISCIIDTESQ